MFRLILVLLLSLPYLASSQNNPAAIRGEKSIKPLPAVALAKEGVPQSSIVNPKSSITRAVVIGISDYQDPAIPDLRFADRDAEAFANFLRSPAGGSLDANYLKLLTNQQATAGRIAEAFDALIEQTKEGDRVIIYFSGHGDVERKTISQPGFLLCWDSPAQVYMGGGTYSLAFLQEIISTLSTQNKAKVTVISDACHAGKLSGSQIGGTQLTSANLARQFANEVKILSCQPNEYSLEGEQWGGGRGAFSYHFVDGLYGFADRNEDHTITLLEIGRHLEDRVSTEVSPVSQTPMLIGNRAEILARVDGQLLAALRSGKTTQMAILSAIDSRGIEDLVLAGLDSTIRKHYRLFNIALKDKQFFEPKNACADFYYEKLAVEPELDQLHSTMARNYAAALQDDAQQIMNKWLKTDLRELSRSRISIKKKCSAYPHYLQRASDLLGKQHNMYPVLQARKYFFEGYLLNLSSRSADQDLGMLALGKFQEALKWQPDLPHIYWQMSAVYGDKLLQPDSSVYYAKKASELAPTWVLPYTYLAFIFSTRFFQPERAKGFLEQAIAIDSNSVIVHSARGIFHAQNKQFSEAEKYFLKAVQQDSSIAVFYDNLGTVYRFTRRLQLAELALKKALTIDSTLDGAQQDLGYVYLLSKRFAEAESCFKKAIELDSTFYQAHLNLGFVLEDLNRPREAEHHYLIATRLDPKNFLAFYNLVGIYIVDNQVEKAFEYLEKAIERGFNKYEEMQEDPSFEPFRQQSEKWKILMKKHFPDKVKD